MPMPTDEAQGDAARRQRSPKRPDAQIRRNGVALHEHWPDPDAPKERPQHQAWIQPQPLQLQQLQPVSSTRIMHSASVYSCSSRVSRSMSSHSPNKCSMIRSMTSCKATTNAKEKEHPCTRTSGSTATVVVEHPDDDLGEGPRPGRQRLRRRRGVERAGDVSSGRAPGVGPAAAPARGAEARRPLSLRRRGSSEERRAAVVVRVREHDNDKGHADR